MKTIDNHSFEPFLATILILALCLAAGVYFTSMLHIVSQFNDGVQQSLSQADSYADYLSRK